MLAESGVLNLANNWSKTGWRNSFEGAFNGSVTGGSSFVIGTAPGFVDAAAQDFRLVSAASVENAGTSLHADALALHNVARHYVKHQSSETRPVSGAFDIGAYEFAAIAPLQMLTTSLPDSIRLRPYDQPLQAAGGSGSYAWAVSTGALPPGIYLDPATGIVRGRARLKGTWNFTITAQDTQNVSQSVSRPFTIISRLHI